MRHITKPGEEHELLAELIAGTGCDGKPVRILEAGCGHHWPVDLGSTPRHITGIDRDPDALRIRRDQLGDLDDEILGDLHTAQIPLESFDVAYCSFVLEHVENAEGVMGRLYKAIRPGGLLIVKVPDGDSVYGWLVKHSPHRAHVWYKRYVERKPHAGEPGHAPYPTVYDPVVSVKGLRDWAERSGAMVQDEYCSNGYLRAFGPVAPVVSGVLRMIAWCSRGRLTSDHNNIGVVFLRPA